MTELNLFPLDVMETQPLDRFLGNANKHERGLFLYVRHERWGFEDRFVYRHVNSRTELVPDADGHAYAPQSDATPRRVPRRIALHQVRATRPTAEAGRLAVVVPFVRTRRPGRKPRPGSRAS